MIDEIKHFLAVNAGISTEKLTDSLDLFESEVWDSLLIVRFFAFADKQFGRKIDLASVREDDIRSLRAIEAFLNSAVGSAK